MITQAGTLPSASSAPSEAADGPQRPACLVLHGLGGGPYELSPLIASLQADGLCISAPVLPGHEPSGPVMPASCWRDWAAAAERAFDELAARGGPVVVVGFSTGATLSLYLAHRKPVARQVLLAPFLAIRYTRLLPFHPAGRMRALARVLPDLPRRPPAVRDPEMRRWAAATDHFRTFNVSAAVSALELIEEVKTLVPAIAAPSLIIQGKRDTVVDPGHAAWLHQHIGSEHKSLVILPRSDHLVALDFEREQVIALTREFILPSGTSAGMGRNGAEAQQ
jgi:carboxylesterase